MMDEKKTQKIPTWLIITIAVLFIALTVAVVMLIIKGSEDTKPTESESMSDELSETPSETVQVLTDPGYGNNTANALSTYAVLAAEPGDVDMSAIVAVNDASEACLNNGELQIYYWIEFYSFMDQYSYYASMMGLDSTKPLSEQNSMMEGYTWEQYFLESASKHYGENYALAQAAYENGYVISDENAANIADMDDPNGNFAKEALEYGYESVEAYIQANFGNGVGVEDYKNYLTTYYAAADYYNQMSAEYKAALTDAEIEAHYDENVESFEGQGLTKVNNVAVRHILISVDGEPDENNEYPEEAWAAAEATANDLYAQWQNDATEENFIALANEKSTDPGSNTNGGLYEDIYPGQMVTEFNDWCFDASRAYGDHGIVKTSYGYHIMFFVEQCETRKWFDAAQEDLLGVKLNDMLTELSEKYPLKFDFTKVRLYDMIAANAAIEETE